MSLIDYGDAMVETKQVSPGIRPDWVYGFGLFSGSPDQDVDMARFMLARASAVEGVGTSERTADV
jgi:hypothetical protein